MAAGISDPPRCTVGACQKLSPDLHVRGNGIVTLGICDYLGPLQLGRYLQNSGLIRAYGDVISYFIPTYTTRTYLMLPFYVVITTPIYTLKGKTS
jgi:hypothetical protein